MACTTIGRTAIQGNTCIRRLGISKTSHPMLHAASSRPEETTSTGWLRPLWPKVRRTFLMPQRNAELMERESAAVGHVYVVLNVFLRGREIAGSAHFAGAVPGEHLDGGILRENASSDLQSNGDAKVNLKDSHSPPPASLP